MLFWHLLCPWTKPLEVLYVLWLQLLKSKLTKFLLELNTNDSLKKTAKEQAGLERDQDFQISNLINYNIDNIVAELLKKHLSNTNFTGASVHNNNIIIVVT